MVHIECIRWPVNRGRYLFDWYNFGGWWNVTARYLVDWYTLDGLITCYMSVLIGTYCVDLWKVIEADIWLFGT